MQPGQIKLLIWGCLLPALFTLSWYGCNSNKHQQKPENLLFDLEVYKPKFESCSTLDNNCILGTHNMHMRKLDTLAFFRAFQHSDIKYPKSTAVDEGVYFRCYQDSFKHFNMVWFFTNVIDSASYDEFVTYTKQGKLIEKLGIPDKQPHNNGSWLMRYAHVNKDTIIALDSYNPAQGGVRNYYLVTTTGNFKLIKSDTVLANIEL